MTAMHTSIEGSSPVVGERARTLYERHRDSIFGHVDRLFASLMLLQWAAGVVIALVYSPYAWAGKQQVVHVHVLAAVLLGGLITAMPVALASLKPGWVVTRYVIAAAQMLWSALLIHLTGGRIETHFHVFGSLAFLAFYRDWKVLVPATLVAASDHLVRQIFWPESVYGIVNPEQWRFAEHAFWVLFEDVILAMSCLRGQAEMREIAMRQADLEALWKLDRERVDALAASQQALVRAEKLAVVGKLAASVGHELRNPLTAIKNASAILQKRLGSVEGQIDPKIAPFLGILNREVSACSRIVRDLLDFASERPLQLVATPLRALVDESITLLPDHPTIQMVNEVSDDLQAPVLDRDQFRQVLINLLQNALEAIEPGREDGRVVVTAEGGGGRPFSVTIEDTGMGMDKEIASKIFEPLFTTKVKGTGLGMAIVANVVRQHGAQIRVDSEVGRGTRVVIEFPETALRAA